MKMLAATATSAAYVACVVLANVLTEHYGLVAVGFGLYATAGTFAAGAVLACSPWPKRWDCSHEPDR